MPAVGPLEQLGIAGGKAIHETAIVSSHAEIGDGVRIGPGSIVGAHVKIGSGCELGAYVVVSGHTTIGLDNKIYHFCTFGGAPQDMRYAGENTSLIVGDGNVFREYCSVHSGTVSGLGKTVVGSHNWIMSYVHIAHDCVLGNHSILANNTAFSGHVRAEDYVVCGGYTLVPQHRRIGCHAYTGGATKLVRDVAPYTCVSGIPAYCRGINKVGLERKGFSSELRRALYYAYRKVLKENCTEEMPELKRLAETYPEVKHFLGFIRKSEVGVIRPAVP